jgi:hypothetical protein
MNITFIAAEFRMRVVLIRLFCNSEGCVADDDDDDKN